MRVKGILTMPKHFAILCLILLTLGLGLTGCSNTFKGAGKDLQKIGRSVEDTF